MDTGSEYTWVPAGLLEGLGVAREKKDQAFVMANGQQITRSLGFAIIRVENYFTIDEVVFAEPGDLELLGARTLEGLNLMVDPQRKTLVAAGPVPAASGGTMVQTPRIVPTSAMDTAVDYRRIVRRLIEEYPQFRPSVGEVEVEVIIDEKQGHYELMHAGWMGYRRVHGSLIHIDIRGDKIWIQHDGTEAGVANDLVAAGIPKDRIVLAFKSPGVPPLTGFATP